MFEYEKNFEHLFRIGPFDTTVIRAQFLERDKVARDLSSRESRPVTKAELIQALADRQTDMTQRDAASAVACLQQTIVDELACGGRVEIRGFGSFSVRHWPARRGRNPGTGAIVDLPDRCIPYFRSGKVLAQRVNGQAR